MKRWSRMYNLIFFGDKSDQITFLVKLIFAVWHFEHS